MVVTICGLRVLACGVWLCSCWLLVVECYCCSGFGVVLLDLLLICGCGLRLVFAWVVGFAILFLVGGTLWVPVCGSFTSLGFSVLMLLLWFVGLCGLLLPTAMFNSVDFAF